jgi:hypothetical protein
MYTGRLTAAFIVKATKEGKPTIAVGGKRIGGIHFYADRDTVFDEAQVDMGKIQEFADCGFLDLNLVTSKSRPRVEPVEEDLITKAEKELAEDAEIEAEVAAVKRCAAITASGEQCKRNAVEGSDYCGLHKGK